MREKIKISRENVNVKTEIIAGLTGFFAISYIIIVNPMILANAGIPADLSVFATIFTSALGCLLMWWFADAPIIMTPGMGVNAFFTYTLVISMKMTWQEAIAISIVASVIYIIIAYTKLSTLFAEAIPASLKTGITAGIGIFLVTIGLENAKLIQSGGAHSLLKVGDLTSPDALLALFGLILTVSLFIKKVPGSFVIGIVVTTILGIIFHVGQGKGMQVSFSRLAHYNTILFKGDFSHLFSAKFLLAVFSMTMILVFSSMGILEGILPYQKQFKPAFEVSAISSFTSGFLGTCPTVTAAESASAIEAGGRTGITALSAGIMFLISLLLIPFLSYVPQAAIAPVIIMTGSLMLASLESINFKDYSDWFPAFLITVLIPLTGSISTGLAIGFVAYPIVKLAAGKRDQISFTLVILSILFLLQLICDAVFFS